MPGIRKKAPSWDLSEPLPHPEDYEALVKENGNSQCTFELEKAIALDLVIGTSVRTAAKKRCCSPETVMRIACRRREWVDHYKEIYKEHTIGYLCRGIESAVDALIKVLGGDADDATKTKASDVLLSHGVPAWRTDVIDKRFAQMEEMSLASQRKLTVEVSASEGNGEEDRGIEKDGSFDDLERPDNGDGV